MSEKEEDGKVTLKTLLTVLALFSSIWFGLIRILIYLVNVNREMPSSYMDSVSFSVLIFSFFVLLYVLLIIRGIYFETVLPHLPEVDVKKLTLERKKLDKRIKLGWVLVLFLIILIPLFVIFIPLRVGLIPLIVLSVVLFFVLYFLVTGKVLKNKGEYTKQKIVCTFLRDLFSIGGLKEIINSVFINLFLFMLYLMMVVAFTSGVEINLNQDRYAINEPVVVEILPYGLISPEVSYVLYSNENKILYDGTKEPYPASHRIVQIPSKMLTDKPYNSYVKVVVSYFVIGKINYYKKIPVYVPIE